MKKNNLLIAILFFFAVMCSAQNARPFNEPLVVSDPNGNNVSNKSLTFRVTIIDSAGNEKIPYQETDTATTNSRGEASLFVGSGKRDKGNFQSLVKNHPYLLQVEYKTGRDSSYVALGTSSMPNIFPEEEPGDMLKRYQDFYDALNRDTSGHGRKAPTGVGAYDPNLNTTYGGLVQDLPAASQGSDVVGIGTGASANTGFGTWALGPDNENLTGVNVFSNTAVGAYALTNIWRGAAGAGNTGIGTEAGQNIINGFQNTATGAYSLAANNNSNNCAYGYDCMRNNTGTQNSAFGLAALGNLAPGNNNAAFGFGALSNSNASDNTALGTNAMNGSNPETGGDNVAVGEDALYFNTKGADNVASGYDASYENQTGSNNVATGWQALYENTIGTGNVADGYQAAYGPAFAGPNYRTAVGYQALFNDKTDYITGMGYRALYFNTLGTNNTAMGNQAMYNNITGSWNTAVGDEAMLGVTNSSNASDNTAVGYRALFAYITGGGDNTAIGFNALFANTNGKDNTATGSQALLNNLAGSQNTANGFQALFTNAAGNYNTAGGYQAAFTNKAGMQNTALGAGALYTNAAANDNTALGYYALYKNTVAGNTAVGSGAGQNNGAGTELTAVGFQAGQNNTTAIGLTALGYRAAALNITAQYSTAVGALALSSSNNAAAVNNTAIGGWALLNNVSGLDNTSLGFNASHFNNSGSYNTSLGSAALYMTTTGNDNVAAGYRALLTNAGGSDNTALGYQADVATGALTFATVIGSGAIVTANNNMILGNNTTHVGIGMSALTGGVSTFTKLEISAYSAASSSQCSSPIPSSTFTATACSGINPTGSSGLQFRDLTDASVPYAYKAGHGFLTVDDVGNVVYMASGGGGTGIGTCNTSATTFNAGDNGWINLTPNTANFYFDGQSTNPATTDVVIGNTCGYTPKAKLDILQHSTVPIGGSIGIYVENKDISSYCVPTIGIESLVDGGTNSPTATNPLQIAGLFRASPSYNLACPAAYNMYAIVVPASGGVVSLGYPVASLCCGSAYAQLQVDGTCSNVGGVFVGSDSTIKTNVGDLKNAISVISKLRGVSYNYTPNIINDSGMAGTHYGFIAQEVQRVLPSSVKSISNPNGGNALKGVSYYDIIPWLVEGMKAQQQIITRDSARISQDSIRHLILQSKTDSILNYLNSIKACLDSLCNSKSEPKIMFISNNNNNQSVSLSDANAAILYQNIPNPFASGGTKINYFIPQGISDAKIMFFDTYGNKIKEVDITPNTGMGSINVNPENLSNGIYSYSLIVNGQIIDTKRMVFEK